MKKIIVYGIGKYLKNNAGFLPKNLEIIAYGDGNLEKATSVSGKKYNGKDVLMPKEILNITFDYLYISVSTAIENIIYEELTDIGISKEKIRFLSRLRAYPNWNYFIDREGIIVSDIGGIRIRETDKNDRGVLGEIFGNRQYNIDIKKNSVVVDFGMNVGAATLFFASNENVEKVYGFEPFPDTYEKARKNIEISDDHFSQKITTYNCAVSNFGGVREIPVMTEFSGGRTTELGYLKTNGSERMESILYKEAKVVLEEIIVQNRGKHIVLKIDTEGSEFEIFDSIKNTSLLERFDAIVMEYHRDPLSIEECLRLSSYRLIRTGDNEIGLIYAVNMKERIA